MIVKKHLTNDNMLVLSICDENLIGQIFVEGDKQLDLTSGFYSGNKLAKEDVLDLLDKAYMINAIGKNSIKLCVEAGVIDKDKVGKVKDVPYALMVRF